MHPARRRVRQFVGSRPGTVAVVAVVLLALAAVVGFLYFTGSPAAASPAAAVPANATYVGHVDAERARSSPDVANTTEELTRFQSAVDFYDGPPFRRSYLFRESNLSADAVAGVTYFGRVNSSYGARIVRAEWERSDLVATVEADANVTLTRGEHRGRAVFAGDGRAVAVLEDGRFAVGNETAVRDAVDVAAGERSSVSGPLRERFDDREGYLRFAYRFRSSTVPDYSFVGESIRSVEYVATGYRVNGSNVTTEAVVVTEDAESARGVKGLLAFARTIYRTQTDDAALATELQRVRFETERRTVAVGYTSTRTGYHALLRGLYEEEPEQRGGTGDGGTTPTEQRVGR